MCNGDIEERVVRTRRVKIVNKTACAREDEGRKKSWGELLYMYPPRVEEQSFVYLTYLGNGRRKARLPSERPAAPRSEIALAAIFPAFEIFLVGTRLRVDHGICITNVCSAWGRNSALDSPLINLTAN